MNETEKQAFFDKFNLKIEEKDKSHCNIIDIPNGSPVVMIDREHDEWNGEVDPLLAQCLGNPNCQTYVPEYFLPDLKRNESKYPEVLKKLVGFSSDNSNAGYGNRGEYFYSHAKEFIQGEGKRVSVVDIANCGLYEVYFNLWPFAFSLAGVSTPIAPTLKVLSSLAPIIMKGLNAFSDGQKVKCQKTNENGVGIFDKKKISWYEKFMYDFEDARRVYAAKAIEKLSIDTKNEYPNQDQFLTVVYPKAHAMRITDYLTKQNSDNSLFTKFKEFVYHYPGLEFSTRTYENKKSYKQGENFWDQVSNTTY